MLLIARVGGVMHVGISRSFENDVFIVEIGAGCFLVDLKNQTVLKDDFIKIYNLTTNLKHCSYNCDDEKLDEIEYLMYKKGFLKIYNKPSKFITVLCSLTAFAKDFVYSSIH